MEILALLNCIVAILNDRKVRYAIAGGLAYNIWVAPERVRETVDIDLAIGIDEDEVLKTLSAALEDQGFTVLPAKPMPFRRATIERLWVSKITVDFIWPRDSAFVKSAMSRVLPGMSGGLSVPFLSPEDLFLYKALSKRERDVAPMCDLADAMGFDTKYVEKWARKLGVWLFAKRCFPENRGGE